MRLSIFSAAASAALRAEVSALSERDLFEDNRTTSGHPACCRSEAQTA
jgi:hypothetical protein